MDNAADKAAINLRGREARFGSFRLLPSRQQLLCGDEVLRLGGRAFDVLRVLVENAGEVVEKQALMTSAWPNTYVEECNLRTAVAAVRRVLNTWGSKGDYLETVPGRGYRFIAPVSIMDGKPRRSLPSPLSRIIGRDHAVGALAAELRTGRFLTIVGAGGIGKTTVAVSAARLAIEQRQFYSASLVDLAHLRDPKMVLSAIRSGLGFATTAGDDLSEIRALLADRRHLIVLDSCEPFVAEVSAAVRVILSGAPSSVVLATSREPLRAAGERIWRLDPLTVPPPYAAINARSALSYSAVELFCERATANSASFRLTDDAVRHVAEICRKLDGLPLAIELAAGRLDTLEVAELAAELTDYFRLHMPGRNTGLPRHRSLQTTLDWSYETLSDAEKVLLRRMSVFCGACSYDALKAVVGGDGLDPLAIHSLMASLAAKSLAIGAGELSASGHRLLDTTRAYALQRLEQSGEAETIKERHARYFEQLVAATAASVGGRSTVQWSAFCAQTIDQVRVALDWATARPTAAHLAWRLAISALPMWATLGLGDECFAQIARIGPLPAS
ncbi:winged helix-turn-helix domain-containing protein [Bradyrhizobium sp. dw_78]|uniref:ATP-binding protein n=1 Tax=Bradyrhizobium sp. dw_78 TaxID=2719793 RepID=UPI001BD68A04|nr:winged helix-turn-helix domain-containing protein [Bradyrhizobium sp. dw_78]